MIQNNFSVQIYDQETDNKLDIIYINNTINLDDNDNDFTRKFEEEIDKYSFNWRSGGQFAKDNNLEKTK